MVADVVAANRHQAICNHHADISIIEEYLSGTCIIFFFTMIKLYVATLLHYWVFTETNKYCHVIPDDGCALSSFMRIAKNRYARGFRRPTSLYVSVVILYIAVMKQQDRKKYSHS